MRLRSALLATIGAASVIASSAASAQASEDSVKAAFLPRFVRYVTWPPTARPGPGEPFNLCVIGSDPYGGALDRAAKGQSIDGHPIVVRRMSSPAAAARCHIAFVYGARDQSTGQLLAAMTRLPVLTVTDSRGGGQRGMIHFVVAGGRVRFFIDESAASRRGLSISSRLLALAVGVNGR